MTISERKKREKKQLRQKILTTAAQIIAKEGYQNLSMRKLADIIEYSPTTIYHYFKDKADLLLNIREDVFERLIVIFEEIRAKHEEQPLIVLKEMLRAYIMVGVENPYLYKVLFLSELSLDQEVNFGNEDMPKSQQAFGLLFEAIGKCISAGVIAEADNYTTAKSLFASIHGMTDLMLLQIEPWPNREEIIDRLLSLLINGLRS